MTYRIPKIIILFELQNVSIKIIYIVKVENLYDSKHRTQVMKKNRLKFAFKNLTLCFIIFKILPPRGTTKYVSSSVFDRKKYAVASIW